MDASQPASVHADLGGEGQSLLFTAMGGGAELRLTGLAPAAARAALEAAEAEVRRIEQKYSRYRADSLLSRINAAAGSGQEIAVDAETAGLIEFAAKLHAQSAGRFDLTSGVLRRAWDFRSGRVPTMSELRPLLALIGWPRVRWRRVQQGSEQGGAIALPEAGMELDFGGIGKEYAADRAAGVLREAGAAGGWVNLAGDLRVIGPRADGRPWSLAVQHPRRPGEVLAGVELADGALATSGDYERYFERDGRRYCHLLDPRSGWPAEHWQSVSVIAPVCLAAGALSTLAMLMGAEAPAFLRAQGVRFLAVDVGGRVHEGGA